MPLRNDTRCHLMKGGMAEMSSDTDSGRHAEYVAVPGWCGFEKEDGAIAIVGTEDALILAQHYEPFAVYRRVPEGHYNCGKTMSEH